MSQSRSGKIRVAAVGLGWVSQNRHLPAIVGEPRFELTGVVDPHAERGQATAQKYGVRFAQSRDLTSVPWMSDVDAIVIGAPPGSHADLVSQALALGKHVLTEKPFVMDVADGERLIAEADKAQRVLAIVHNFQFARSFLKARADIAAGRLGHVRNVWAMQLSNPRRRLPIWYEDLPGGLFFDESPHLLYLVRRLLPDLALNFSRVTPSSEGAHTPAEVYAQMRNADGQTATLLMNFEAALSEWHVVVSGEHGTADVDVFRDIYIFTPNDGLHTAGDILRNSFSAVAGHLLGTVTSGLLHVRSKLNYGNSEVFGRFAAAIAEGNLQPELIGSHEALAVRRLQQQILES